MIISIIGDTNIRGGSQVWHIKKVRVSPETVGIAMPNVGVLNVWVGYQSKPVPLLSGSVGHVSGPV
jgi:hypothetical protein